MASVSTSGYFEYSLENGLALIMTAGGATPCGNNFVAGRDDVVFKVWGNYTMTIDDNNYVTICLTDMYALIFQRTYCNCACGNDTGSYSS